MTLPPRKSKIEANKKRQNGQKEEDNFMSLIRDQIPHYQHCFQRSIGYQMVHYDKIDEEYKLKENEIDFGILVSASIPFKPSIECKQIEEYIANPVDYIVVAFFDNESKYYISDPMKLLRDDMDYHEHMENVKKLQEVPWMDDVFKHFSFSLLSPKEHELRGQKKLAIANTKQSLHRFARKVYGKLRFDLIQKGKCSCRVDLNYHDWNIGGHEFFIDLAESYALRAGKHIYSSIGIEKLKEIVGLGKLSKKMENGEVYKWIDEICISYNIELQSCVFRYIMYDDEENKLFRSQPNVRRSKRIAKKTKK